MVSGPNLIYEIVKPKLPMELHKNQFLSVVAEPDLDVIAQIAH